MPPMQQIGARYMSPVMSAVFLVDVAHVMTAAPEDVPVGIKRHGVPLGIDEMESGPVRIGQQL